MKIFSVNPLLAVPVALSMASALAYGQDNKSNAKLKTDQDKVSYILGHQIGGDLKRNEVQVNLDAFLEGIKEALAGKESTISQADAQKIMAAFQQDLRAKSEKKQKEVGAKNEKEGKDFLAANGKKSGVTTLPSGLQYQVLQEGKGEAPKATDTVVTHYRGTLIDGTEFDSSYSRGEPAKFPVSGVIKGWTEALQLMKPGAKWKLFVPSELAYGANGAGPKIGPNATLLFDVELISVEGKASAGKEKAATTKK